MPIRNVNSGPPPVGSNNTHDVEAGNRAQDPQNRPGGAGGGRPRVSNTNSTQSTGPFRSIMNFFTRIFTGSSSAPVRPHIPEAQNQAQNRQILFNLNSGKETNFSTALQEGIQEAEEQLKDVPGTSNIKTREEMTKLVLSALQMKPDTEVYTPQSLKEAITKQVKIETIKVSVMDEAHKKLEKAGVPSDHGSAATLLLSSSTKYIDMKQFGTADKNELPDLRAKLVKSMVQEGISQYNYGEAKKEALGKGEQMLKDVGLNEENSKKEMKDFKMDIDKAALKLEEQLTEKNGGMMPAIAKHQYGKVFDQQVDALGVRLGISIV